MNIKHLIDPSHTRSTFKPTYHTMHSYKQNCTKGPVDYTKMLIPASEKDRRSGFVVNGPDGGPDMPPVGTNLARRICDIRTGVDVPYAMAQANASLIAEAFNVLHHRGFTPLELVEHKGILIAALKELMESFACKCADNENPEWTPSYDRAEKLIRDIEQGNDLSKHQPKLS